MFVIRSKTYSAEQGTTACFLSFCFVRKPRGLFFFVQGYSFYDFLWRLSWQTYNSTTSKTAFLHEKKNEFLVLNVIVESVTNGEVGNFLLVLELTG